MKSLNYKFVFKIGSKILWIGKSNLIGQLNWLNHKTIDPDFIKANSQQVMSTNLFRYTILGETLCETLNE